MSDKDGQICNKCFQRPVYCECDLESLRQQLKELTQERDEAITKTRFWQDCTQLNYKEFKEEIEQKAEAQAQKYKDKLTQCSAMFDEVEDALADSCRREGKLTKALENILAYINTGSDLFRMKDVKRIIQEALQGERKESTTYECKHAWVKHIGDTSAVCSKCGMPEPPPDTWKGESKEDKPDLSKCPECGGLADNGHDRCDPPNVYSCTKCSKSEADKT